MKMAVLICVVTLLCTPLVTQAVAVVPGLKASTQEQPKFLQADAMKPKLGKSREADRAEEEAKKEAGWVNPFVAPKHHPSDRLMCGITETVGANTDKYEDCPASCPYFAQNRKDTTHCTFLCVPGDECGTWNPNKPIPANIKNTKTCRGPMVPFCQTPNLAKGDTCAKCSNGYDLWAEDEQCYFKYWTPLIVVALLFAVFMTVGVLWAVDLCCREVINPEAVEKAEAWRSRSKILTSPDHEGHRSKWPLMTNMCTTNVAGPGMMLHFRFQAFFIFWPFCLALVWTALACFHNELFILGTRKFGTPRHNCILVAWGYETQQRLMWTKVLFLVIAYVFSFVSFLVFGVMQLRSYNRIDATEKTMKDFAIEMKGLPELKGPEVEKDLQKAVEEATGKKLVGVSVAWNYGEEEEKISMECRKDLDKREAEVDPDAVLPVTDEACPSENMNGLHKWMYNKEKELLGPDEEDDRDIKAILEGFASSDTAFLVFNTEEDKEEVLEKFKTIKWDAKKYDHGEVELTIGSVANEPANLNWHNFKDSDPTACMVGFFKGVFTVYVPALLVWFFGFYVPYALSLYYFNYDNGAELPGYYSLIFTVVICGGNATMYVVCDVCCDMIGFRYKDTKQVAYMLMYLVACMINVFLDMVVTYYTAMKIMVGLDFRTYHGTRLADIDTFTEQFETYAMQRSLGENTYRYAWPSTFFLCFVLEPFVTILIPYKLGRVVVRTHKEITGSCAEAYIMAFEFDLGRYADILLNVFLGIVIFYFPGGYIWTLFFAMAFSHTFIYCFDHYRVLNTIPFIKLVSNEVDFWSQIMMAGCCAVILSCLVFKANCETYTNYCLQDVALISACTAAGVAHFIVHALLVVYLVPMLSGQQESENEGMTFESAAKFEPRTWFSVNPVHCLRSQYIHGDKPHCHLAFFGKEHLLEVNPKIGCHFFQHPAPLEEYNNDIRKSFMSFSQSFSKAEPDTDAGKAEAPVP